MIFSKLNDASFWQDVRTQERYRFMRDELMRMYEQDCTCPLPILTYSDYCIYFDSGSRKEYETGYFVRRRRMNTLAILCKIYPENQDYFRELENTIWAILDEYSWAFPAHMPSKDAYEPYFIDLFAAETGYTISEIKQMFFDRFSPLMKKRISVEMEKRIISPYLSTHYGWEDYPENWAAVCAGSVGVVFMYENPEGFLNVKARIKETMEVFLSSYKDDGVCREGLGYWSYGFGYFCYYAAHLKEFTKGQDDLFQDPKVKTIAMFQQEVFLKNNIVVSFADAGTTDTFFIGLTHYIKGIYGEDITIPPQNYGVLSDTCGRWGAFSFSFLYYNPAYLSEEKIGSRLFPDSAWYIHRENAYAFAAKGGDNDEPHNHNDLGGFLIADESGQILVDLGCGEYTRQYFDPETRYSILCNSSLGHSVPIIGGEAQKEGAEYTASLTKTEEGISIDLTHAYDIQNAESIKRDFTFTETEITMTDTYAFSSPTQVTERFVSMIKPEITENGVKLGNMTLATGGLVPTVSEDIHYHHEIGPAPSTVYLIDFDLDAEKNTAFTVTCRMDK